MDCAPIALSGIGPLPRLPFGDATAMLHQAQYLVYGLLYDTVYYGGDAEQSRLSSTFGYLDPPYGIGAVASAKQTFSRFILVFPLVRKLLVYLHSVDSTTPLVGLDLQHSLFVTNGSLDIHIYRSQHAQLRRVPQDTRLLYLPRKRP